MAVKAKSTENKEDKGRVVGFSKEDFMAVEGTAKSFFNGKVKVVHKVQGEKMIANGQAKASKVELEEVKNENRIVKDIKEKN